MDNTCDDCEKEAQFVLDDGTKYCCEHMIEVAQDREKSLDEQDGFEDIEVTEMMRTEMISRTDAIKKLKEQRGDK